jgi:hypothetical protein
MAVIGYVGYNAYERGGLSWRIDDIALKQFSNSIKWDVWNSNLCSNQYRINPCLQSADSPKVLILGDSHANHLYPGLTNAFPDIGFLSIGICGSFLDVASRFTKHDFGNNGCPMNASITKNIDAVKTVPSIQTIIISGLWRSSIDGEFITKKEKNYFGPMKHYSLWESEKDLTNRELAWAGLARTIDLLLKSKKAVIFARDVPSLPRDIRDLCINRFIGKNKLLLDCVISKSFVEEGRISEDWFVQKIQERYPQVLIYDPLTNPDLCTDTDCFAAKEGIPLYRDQHHLSRMGSNLVADGFKRQYGLLIGNVY